MLLNEALNSSISSTTDATQWAVKIPHVLGGEAVGDDDISIVQPPPPPLSPQLLDKELELLGGSLSLAASVSAPSSSRGKRKRLTKAVSFASDALWYQNDWSQEEVQNSWYAKAELDGFKQERKETVRQLKRTGFDLQKISTKYCLRGYEAYFSIEMNKAVKYARELVSCVVFCEQQRQRLHGVWDAERLRQRSEQASAWARDNAAELGSTDAQETMSQLRLEETCLGLPYCPHHATCELIHNSAQSQLFLPSRVSLVDTSMVRELQSALQVTRQVLAQA